MEKFEFRNILQPLLTAFEKTFPDKLWDLWFEELKGFDSFQLKEAVKHFLNSDESVFPKIGKFKNTITGSGTRKTPEGRHIEPPSCHRCHHGIATVIRYIDQRKHSFAFRCSCTSGSHYPGFPLVSDEEQTLKEYRNSSLPIPYPEPSQWEKQKIIERKLNDIPF